MTFIVDPVLSGDEIKSTAQTYQDLITNEGASIVHTDAMGLKQLAYPINRKSSGIYYSIEFSSTDGGAIPKLELALKRDERIMRFLSIRLDRYGVKYNADKRAGLIGKPRAEEPAKAEEPKAAAPAPKAEPAKTEAPKAAAPSSEEE